MHGPMNVKFIAFHHNTNPTKRGYNVGISEWNI